MQLDQRRFRANIVVSSDDDQPFVEDAWGGRTLTFGDADTGPALSVTLRDERGMMVNLDPDTARQDAQVMKAVVAPSPRARASPARTQRAPPEAEMPITRSFVPTPARSTARSTNPLMFSRASVTGSCVESVASRSRSAEFRFRGASARARYRNTELRPLSARSQDRDVPVVAALARAWPRR